ncbi:MAG: GNAT family N-acetyltransferase [Gorillibacterium sp.]|nr:GNAT family N-acetyltransferase [Gorillibacterium sp.]
MLIRHVTFEDVRNWLELAADVAEVFRAPDMANDREFHEYMQAKINKYEAFMAVDYVSNRCMGIIGFSKNDNRITWFGVFEKHRNKGVGSKLLKCALNQLDWKKEITVETYSDDYMPGVPAKHVYRKFGFEDIDTSLTDKLGNPIWQMAIGPSNLKKAGSFHHNYVGYMKMVSEEFCPVCQNEQGSGDIVTIIELQHSWVECSKKAQGRLFGKCHVLSKKHSNHFYDMPPEDMANFMGDVQLAAKVLHKVTGSVKINYEIHGNTMPHLHVHLFPRYIDDLFPSGAIDIKITEPSAYENDAEFNWFVEKMKHELMG